MTAARICCVPGCGRVHRAKGYCSSHWRQVVFRGMPAKPLRPYRHEPAERLELAAEAFSKATTEAELRWTRERLREVAVEYAHAMAALGATEGRAA